MRLYASGCDGFFVCDVDTSPLAIGLIPYFPSPTQTNKNPHLIALNVLEIAGHNVEDTVLLTLTSC